MQVRLLQQSDVIEAEEPFAKGQKGSSAMPHKRNPITAERVCGLARTVKSNAQVAFDNVALWYERDISHSGAERVALADSFIALDYMFGKMQWMLDGLQTYPAKMEHNPGRTKASSSARRCCWRSGHRHQPRGRLTSSCNANAMKVWRDIRERRGPDTPIAKTSSRPRGEPSAPVLDEIFDPWTSSPVKTWYSTASRSWSSKAAAYHRRGIRKPRPAGLPVFDGCDIFVPAYADGLGRRRRLSWCPYPYEQYFLASPSRLVVDVCVRDHGIARAGGRQVLAVIVSAAFHVEGEPVVRVEVDAHDLRARLHHEVRPAPGRRRGRVAAETEPRRVAVVAVVTALAGVYVPMLAIPPPYW